MKNLKCFKIRDFVRVILSIYKVGGFRFLSKRYLVWNSFESSFSLKI